MLAEHDTPILARRPDTLGDPWTTAALPDDHAQHAWLISYIDILLLLITLLVLLLAWQRTTPRQHTANVPATKVVVPPQHLPPPPVFRRPQTPDIHPGYAKRAVETPPMQTKPRQEAVHTGHTTAPAIPVPVEVSAALPKPTAEQELVAIPREPAEDTAVATADPPRDPTDQPVSWSPPDDLKEQVDMTRQDRQIRLDIKDTLLFESASADLKPQATTVLQNLVALLGRHPGRIAVEGHTDDRPIATPRYPSNWELSAARASTVARYLIQHGIAAERVQAIGYADTRPRTANDSTEGRARNRRVSLVMYPPQPTR